MLQLMVVVWRRMYAFQESDPASRPPPVSFSPPKAPPISAPDVPKLTLAIPQSLPSADRNRSADLQSIGEHGGGEAVGHAVVAALDASSRLLVAHKIQNRRESLGADDRHFAPRRARSRARRNCRAAAAPCRRTTRYRPGTAPPRWRRDSARRRRHRSADPSMCRDPADRRCAPGHRRR